MPCRSFAGVIGGAFTRAAGRSLLVALFVVPWIAAAAPADVSLQEAIRRATEHAPMLEARRAAVDAAQQESYRAGALPDPMLFFGIDNLPITGNNAFDTRVDDMTMKKIGLRQEIPARAKRKAQRELAGRQIDEAQALSEAEGLTVRQAVADAWIDLWAAQNTAFTLQRLREQAKLAAKLAKARYAGGGGSAADTLAAEAAVLELDNRIEEARSMQAVAQAGLARWLGEPAIEASKDIPDFSVLPVSEAQLLDNIEHLGPLLAANAKVESSAAQVDVARAEKRPDWSVAASYGQRSGGRDDMLMLEVGIGLPLFARNRQDRGVAARQADYQATLATREDLRRQEAARIRADVARWEGLKRQVALHEQGLLPLARDRSTTALATYRAGGELQPWLDARRDELAIHLSHAEHLGELGRAWAALAFLLPTEAQP
ncbi:TolC family protein [Pseudoxanthomonas winnipegensis]|uniref:TolC family protein n=1 Tax=Pseudoxanthomonas winnipegensis TaxID=2480810 RepID=A0A4Q9THA0_9GAMM|nr:TolC family protein [Pseudoxanthomonas winnipegensis]RZZ87756.1 TolC family protein [Pseudoxanthomonas winnipegensis]TAA29894.1 TolC family protein [Pseudoxanthomonas winnipegensis]TBV76296.1 TolC family protein [Pseudoxanthomonas winnipegensis]TBV78033.1 TolC family protein [Pseudoxanthomonas winnipegensis]WJI13998.1 TolC family protein [Pseudoxanthomonas winnipegensis]